jgi:hypothetical protein
VLPQLASRLLDKQAILVFNLTSCQRLFADKMVRMLASHFDLCQVVHARQHLKGRLVNKCAALQPAPPCLVLTSSRAASTAICFSRSTSLHESDSCWPLSALSTCMSHSKSTDSGPASKEGSAEAALKGLSLRGPLVVWRLAGLEESGVRTLPCALVAGLGAARIFLRSRGTVPLNATQSVELQAISVTRMCLMHACEKGLLTDKGGEATHSGLA